MNDLKLACAFTNFEDALINLETELANFKEDKTSRNSIILTYMLAYKTCCKALKRALGKEQILTSYPKEVI
jgi:hypothetical protein